jgi:hypothetical protein
MIAMNALNKSAGIDLSPHAFFIASFWAAAREGF